MKKFIVYFLGYCSLLSPISLQANAHQSFQEEYEALENCIPTVLDLRIQKLDLLLRGPLRFTLEYTNSERSINFSSSIKIDIFGECEKESKNKRIIFLVHLPFLWKNQVLYLLDENDINTLNSPPLIPKHQIIRKIFDELILLAKKHIHESFTPDDAIVFMKAPPIENVSEELIVIFENGIPLYQDAFFKINEI
jgi:hypothetical protein